MSFKEELLIGLLSRIKL